MEDHGRGGQAGDTAMWLRSHVHARGVGAQDLRADELLAVGSQSPAREAERRVFLALEGMDLRIKKNRTRLVWICLYVQPTCMDMSRCRPLAVREAPSALSLQIPLPGALDKCRAVSHVVGAPLASLSLQVEGGAGVRGGAGDACPPGVRVEPGWDCRRPRGHVVLFHRR